MRDKSEVSTPQTDQETTTADSIYNRRFREMIERSRRRFISGRSHEGTQATGLGVHEIRDRVWQRIQSHTLPQLPEAVARLDEVLVLPESTSAEVAEALAFDPVIAARILKLTNAPTCGLTREISSLEQAVTHLGRKKLRETVLLTSVIAVFSQRPLHHYDPVLFWRHAFAVGTAASLMAKTLAETSLSSTIEAEDAFIAGLMHDVGKIVFARFFPAEFAAAIELTETLGLRLHESELVTLGAQHTDLGFSLLSSWNMPKVVSECALWHHDATNTGKLVQTVYLADAIAHGLGFAAEPHSHSPKIEPWVLVQLGLAESVIERVAFDVQVAVAESEEMLFALLDRRPPKKQ